MIDGFRYGFFGVSDVSPWTSIGVVLTCFVVLAGSLLRCLPGRLCAPEDWYNHV